MRLFLALTLDADELDAEQIHSAISNAVGIDDEAIVEIICTRENDELELLKDAYSRCQLK